MIYEFSNYQKSVRKILMAFILNPELIKDLQGKLRRLAQDDGQLNGQLYNLTFIEVIQHFLAKGDRILEEVRARPGTDKDIYKAWESAFYELEREVEDLEKNFADLILALWILKQKLGRKSFSIFWEELLRSYPEISEFFLEPGAPITRPINISKISKTRVSTTKKKRKTKTAVEVN